MSIFGTEDVHTSMANEMLSKNALSVLFLVILAMVGVFAPNKRFGLAY